MEGAAAETWHAKLYKLKDDGDWADFGPGNVLAEYDPAVSRLPECAPACSASRA